ncbi:MAG: patatin-like phospholipase family protein [Bacteroidota bacterium]
MLTIRLFLSAICCFVAMLTWAQRPKVAFVLSGGGARGFAHVGALKVLEEAGFKPDIITGTSMGGVVGGLYAIGYRSDTLEKIVLKTDWDDVVYDRVSRRTLNSIERERFDRYFVKFNFEGIKFISYSGFVKGASVHNMLTRLCLPVSGINDFTKLPIPFACVATNIQTGEKVVLNKGNLPDAIRASMAIPSLFTSIEIDNRILVDGGLTQNYPIIEAKDLGADYIIGIDVGTKSSKEELNSFVNVMMESMFLHGYQNFQAEKKHLSINIKPDLAAFSPLDFEEADTIVKIGEAAARAQLPELKALYVKIYGQEFSGKIETNVKQLNKKYKVKEVDIEGLKNVSRTQIKSILVQALDDELSSAELEDIMLQLENTNLFQRIVYRFDNAQNLGKLVITVKEKPRGDVDVGINYNTYHEASLLLGVSYKRFVFKGGTFKSDIRLSSMPRMDVSYYYQSRFRPVLGIEASLNNIRQGFYQDGIKVSTSYNVYSSLYLKSKYNISNQLNIGIGLGIEQVNNRTDAFIAVDEIASLTNNQQANSLMVFYRHDSRDDTYIPTSGGRSLIDIYWVNNNMDLNRSWFSGIMRLERHFKLGSRIHLGNYINVGLNDANFQPGNTQFAYSVGGMLDMRFKNYIPFAGIDFAQLATPNVAHYRFKPSYKLLKNNYVSVLGEVLKADTYVEQLLDFQSLRFAYGASYEYRSPVGPIQFNVSRSTINNTFNFYLNLGYWF